MLIPVMRANNGCHQWRVGLMLSLCILLHDRGERLVGDALKSHVVDHPGFVHRNGWKTEATWDRRVND